MQKGNELREKFSWFHERNVSSKTETKQAKSPSASGAESCRQLLWTGLRQRATSLSTYLLDALFPPLCIGCKEELPPQSIYLCATCAEITAPLMREERCLHCFDLLEGRHRLCPGCLRTPRLAIPHAYVFSAQSHIQKLIQRVGSLEPFASYLLYQWAHLHWPWPDCVAAIPPAIPQEGAQCLARQMARTLQRPYQSLFRIHYTAPFTRTLVIPKGTKLPHSLLLIDRGSSIEWLQHALTLIQREHPSTVHLLSLQEKG